MFYRLNRMMFRVAASGVGVGNHNIERRDELRLLRKLSKILPAEAIILDVGANTGQYARIARKAFPKRTSIRSSPTPRPSPSCKRLPKACGSTPSRSAAQTRPAGCRCSTGQADAGTPFATLVPGVLEQAGMNPVRFEVELTTIDRFCGEQGLDHVDLLKVDVEGSEKSVLEGASAMLSQRKVRLVQFEFNEMNLLSRTTMDDIAALLPGYALHRLLYDGGLLPIDSISPLNRNLFGFQNIVAVRSDKRP